MSKATITFFAGLIIGQLIAYSFAIHEARSSQPSQIVSTLEHRVPAVRIIAPAPRPPICNSDLQIKSLEAKLAMMPKIKSWTTP